jgi:hypothetical protein
LKPSVKHTKRERGSLLKGVLEKIPREAFEHLPEAIEKTMKGKSGIYALYNKDKLYYVGLAASLRGRVKQHTKDKHAKKWDTFSVYIINRAKFLADVEAIILRIGKPKGNSQKGSIPELRILKKILIKESKQKIKESKKIAKEAKKDAKKKVKASNDDVRKVKKISMSLRKPSKRKTRRRK